MSRATQTHMTRYDRTRFRLPGGDEALELWEGEQRRIQSPYLLTRKWSVLSHGMVRVLSVSVVGANSDSLFKCGSIYQILSDAYVHIGVYIYLVPHRRAPLHPGPSEKSIASK